MTVSIGNRSTKPVTWLRAARRVRLIVHELAMIIANIAGAGAACRVCYAVWIIITIAMQKGVGP